METPLHRAAGVAAYNMEPIATFYSRPGDDRPGAVWYLTDTPWAGAGPFAIPPLFADELNDHYLRRWAAVRPPLVIRLPDGTEWSPDLMTGAGTGWDVDGWQPDSTAALTATPAVRSLGYHGFLSDGNLTPDLEGRAYGSTSDGA